MQETFAPTRNPVAYPPRPSRLNARTGWMVAGLIALFWAALRAGLLQGDIVNPGGLTQLLDFSRASLNPDLDPDFLRLTLRATFVTLAYAVCGTFLSVLIGIVGGIFASEVWWEMGGRTSLRARAPWLAIRGLFGGLRSVHEIIWGLIFVNIIGLDPLTAILAIAIPFGAIMAKVFSEILDEIPRAALRALQHSGVSPAQALLYSLLPLALRDWISYGFYRFDCAIRAATVLGIIGAGGLGFQIFVSLKTLKFEQIWTLFYALFLLSALADLWSSTIRRRLGSQVNCSDASAVSQSSDNPRSAGTTDPFIRASLIAVAALVPISFWVLDPDWSKLFSANALEQVRYLARTAWPPDFVSLPLARWLTLISATLSMSILAVAFASLFGWPLSFPAASNFLLPGGLMDRGHGNATLRRVLSVALLLATRGLLLVARAIPAPIWALLLLFVLFPGILPGAIALGIYTVGVLGRLMAEVTENMDERPLSALKTLGASGGQVFLYGVIPPTVPRFIGYLLYRWEEIVRATVVVGLVGAGGLGQLLVNQLASFDNRGLLSTLLVFVAFTLSIDLISNRARRAFRAG